MNPSLFTRAALLPALVFAALTFAHAMTLPTFEGMDEPAHLSSILHFAEGRGRPQPGARVHGTVERAIALSPGPYHQWDDARRKLGGLTYVDWHRVPAAEKLRRERELKTLTINAEPQGQTINWQTQHPPLYYAVVGFGIRTSGVSTFSSAHALARLLSAILFATTGVVLAVFVAGRWGASSTATLFVVLSPMWYVVGARITNDALAIPALGLGLLLAADQMRLPAAQWRLSVWVLAGLASAIALAAKAYGLVFVPVAVASSAVALFHTRRDCGQRTRALFPLVSIAILLAVNGWWLLENVERGAGFTGQNENVVLAARGITTLWDRVPYATTLVVEQPKQLVSAIVRGSAQALYISNWTLGAAPFWFYALQTLTLLIVVFPLRTLEGPLGSVAAVAAIALGTMVVGIAKSVLDFYIVFGETRLAQGYYVWGAGVAMAAALALKLDTLPAARRRTVLLLQAVCLVTGMITDLMFWSGRYDRHPLWRTAVPVGSLRAPLYISTTATSTGIEHRRNES